MGFVLLTFFTWVYPWVFGGVRIAHIFYLGFWWGLYCSHFLPGFLVGFVLLTFFTWVYPWVFGGIRITHLFSFLCCPICLYVLSSVLWCLLRFHIKTMFGSSLPPVICRRRMSYLHYLCLVESNTYCVVYLFCFSLSCVPCVLCTLCCWFLWIVQFWLPLRYSLTFIFPVSCVPYVAGFSGLSNFDCPFRIL